MDDPIIDEHLDHRPLIGQKVPLVVYEDGERLVIGTAEVNRDGTISATVDQHGEGLRYLLDTFDARGFSIQERSVDGES